MSSIHLSELLAEIYKYKRSVDDASEKDVDAQCVKLLLSRKSLTKQLKQFGDGLSSNALKLLEDFAANKPKLPPIVRVLLKEVQSGEKSLAEARAKIIRIGNLANDEDV